MTLLCGIDEAGRGPVLGPLVMAAVALAEEDSNQLMQLGVKDSKLLSAQKREELFDKIIALVSSYQMISIPPALIDQYVLSQNHDDNLNWLEAIKAAELINALAPEKAIVDCPSPNITAYHRFLRDKLHDKKVFLVCEHKADSTYPVVAAASILAKVTRDREVEKLKKEVGIDFGSGYLTDPKTQKFLEQYWDKFDIFRKSWSSWQHYAKMKGQKRLGEW
jgi:ribonuclease HII